MHNKKILLEIQSAPLLIFLFLNWTSACGKDNLNWQHNFRQLCQYKLDRGDCLVPARYQPNLGLGHWVMTQRRQYCHLKIGRSSTLTDSRIALMDALGFVWILPKKAEIIWRKRYNMLREYKSIYGNCMVPQRYKLNPQLGTWVSSATSSISIGVSCMYRRSLVMIIHVTHA